MIRLAKQNDIDPIMDIIRETVALLQAEGNPQWDETYPARSDFLADIAAEELYVYEHEDKVCGVICLNTREPEEYAPVQWSRPGPALVIHRFAVASWTRRQGIGTAILQFADRLAAQQGLNCVKTDTYSLNPNMNRLFQRNGFHKVGEIDFKDKPRKFNCYEKCIIEEKI